jgi:hypothetical protein
MPDFDLYDVQIYLGELQRRATRSDGAVPAQLVLCFEGEEVIKFREMLKAAEGAVRKAEIMSVNHRGRR